MFHISKKCFPILSIDGVFERRQNDFEGKKKSEKMHSKNKNQFEAHNILTGYIKLVKETGKIR